VTALHLLGSNDTYNMSMLDAPRRSDTTWCCLGKDLTMLRNRRGHQKQIQHTQTVSEPESEPGSCIESDDILETAYESAA